MAKTDRLTDLRRANASSGQRFTPQGGLGRWKATEWRRVRTKTSLSLQQALPRAGSLPIIFTAPSPRTLISRAALAEEQGMGFVAAYPSREQTQTQLVPHPAYLHAPLTGAEVETSQLTAPFRTNLLEGISAHERRAIRIRQCSSDNTSACPLTVPSSFLRPPPWRLRSSRLDSLRAAPPGSRMAMCVRRSCPRHRGDLAAHRRAEPTIALLR